MFNKIAICLILFVSSLAAESKVLSFAGSARQDSHNRKLAAEAANIAGELGADATHIDLKDYPIPFYDEDLERDEGMPENVRKIRQMMIESDKIIISSPSYNGSFTAVLKNLLDWVSRDENGKGSREAFKGKKFLIVSTGPGKTGGVNGLRHLRELITNIGGEVVEGDFGVPHADSSFDDEGALVVPELREILKKHVEALLG